MKFEYKTWDEIQNLSDNEMKAYQGEVRNHEQAKFDKLQLEIDNMKKDGVDKTIVNAMESTLTTLKNDLEKTALSVKALKEKAVNAVSEEKRSFKNFLKENSEVLNKVKNGEKPALNSLGVIVNALGDHERIGASDLNSGKDYADFVDNTTEKKPVRKTTLFDIFKKRNVSTEYIKYREENVVTRDAQNVVACAKIETDTKKSWVVKTVELAKVKDLVDICIDMMDDYDFVEGEIRDLVYESVELKSEYDLLLGAVTLATDVQSIASIASAFNPANAAADFSNAFVNPNIEQLVEAMAGQIAVFGKLNKWNADYVVMNHVDFIKWRNVKDLNGNKVVKTVSIPTGDGVHNVYYIGDCQVLTHPEVVADTLYVFDSTQGMILNRKGTDVSASYENDVNFEDDVVTFKAVKRFQFLVKNVNKDAFMKVASIDTALAAISAPTT